MIGAGFAATALHLPALRSLPIARVHTIADHDADRATEAARRFGIARWSRDPRAVLDDPQVEAVAVCTPPTFHADWTVAALDAGKHVLVEKPLALSLDDCDRMLARAARSDRVVTVGFNLRHHRLVRRARTILQGGALGPILLVRSAFTSGARFERGAPLWRWERALGGGVLTEIGVHHYDLWRHLLEDDVTEVFATSFADGQSATVTARSASGALLQGAFSETTGGRNELDLFGRAGQLHLSCYRFDGLELAGFREGYPGSVTTRLRRVGRLARDLPAVARAIRRGGDFVESYLAEWRAFLLAVRGGQMTGASLADGRRAVEIALAALESADTAQPVVVGAPAPRPARAIMS